MLYCRIEMITIFIYFILCSWVSYISSRLKSKELYVMFNPFLKLHFNSKLLI